MALDLDAFVVWRAIAAQPAIFSPIKNDAAKSARTLLVKQLKAKSTDLASAHSIAKALGREIFGLLVDGMKDAEVKSLVTRFDKHHPELKASDANWRRRQLVALASREIQPSAKVAAVKRGKGAAKKPEALGKSEEWYVSAGATRKR